MITIDTPHPPTALQATQSSLNSAGLALILQSFATSLLATANLATGQYSGALADFIQTANKAVAAELIFVGTANFDRVLYTGKSQQGQYSKGQV